MSNDNDLTITSIIPAPVASVYDAWTQVHLVKRWFAPSDTMTVPSAELDVKPDGRYRVEMRNADGESFIVVGAYREIIPNERLVFTWQWEGSDLETTVRVDFRAVDDKTTELTLHHAGFPEVETRNKHEEGWNGCLAMLGNRINDF
ncbi:MAG: SRPBCC domain-containing protein [Gammaproteobacteria bacterium]|nr:SRPBCC domain-containing protein [Gammaproteobacteria bacterium]